MQCSGYGGEGLLHILYIEGSSSQISYKNCVVHNPGNLGEVKLRGQELLRKRLSVGPLRMTCEVI